METNEKVKKNGVLRAIIILLSIVLIVALAAFAYAKYVTMQNGSAQAQIAKWSFDYKILNSAQTAEISNLASTRTDNNGEVNSNTIAPGTSGQFILEIDATGTETLLTYETKMTLTNKPKNLKFYLDSNKTQELVAENETYLALNGFIDLNDNKKRDISIYWDWPIETGSSPSEIEDNDEIDTTFIGKTMSMQIATTGSQVTSNPYANGVASTTINGNITVYNSVQDAIDAAGTNAGAVVTLLNNAQESVTIGATQDIVLNLNGKTLSSNNTIQINGKVVLVGSGNITVEGNSGAIIAVQVNNEAILDVIGNVYVSGTNNGSGTSRAVMCCGQINMYNGFFYGKTYGIVTQYYGELNVKGGKISSNNIAITNQSSSKVNIYSNAVIEGTNYAIVNNNSNSNAIITIYGGTTIGAIRNINGSLGQIIDYR